MDTLGLLILAFDLERPATSSAFKLSAVHGVFGSFCQAMALCQFPNYKAETQELNKNMFDAVSYFAKKR